MPLEFCGEGLVLRVDGDVLEIFSRGAFSHRVPLAWLAVQVQPVAKNMLVRMVSARDDVPLYEVIQKTKEETPGSVVELVIRTDEEPLYRQFFVQVAQLCGRPVVF